MIDDHGCNQQSGPSELCTAAAILALFSTLRNSTMNYIRFQRSCIPVECDTIINMLHHKSKRTLQLNVATIISFSARQCAMGILVQNVTNVCNAKLRTMKCVDCSCGAAVGNAIVTPATKMRRCHVLACSYAQEPR